MTDVRAALRIGIDTGGTFTDFVVYDPSDESLRTFKVPSTPENPALAVLGGLERIFPAPTSSPFQVIHGSTVATNALLERKGARTALVTTAGFRDVLVIGRQDRPDLYDLSPNIPPPLVPDELRLEVPERIGPDGIVLKELDSAAVDALLAELSRAGDVESVAVCLLFSFANPVHERAVADTLRSAGYTVSVSHEILPEYREYERTATTVVNAYVSPIFDRYLGQLENALVRDYSDSEAPRLAVMQSNGGTISPRQARREAVRCILSGPAGGLIASQNLADVNAGEPGKNLLTIDMGGTSTDVSLIVDRPRLAVDAEIGGLPIGVPVLDIHTIGAGGGSIASLDPAGGLRVGPESAGADPGPACYGRTAQVRFATVTDANLALGRLLPDHFLGGRMALHPDKALAALRPLADRLNRTPLEVAVGITRIANAHMVRALRVISVQRGFDPAGFSLVSFGGAGGLHAPDLARELGIPLVVVPKHASTFSALGMLLADVLKDYGRTVMLPGSTQDAVLDGIFRDLIEKACVDLAAEGIREEEMRTERTLDVRFRGQSYDLQVPFSPVWREDFDRLYRSTYGYAPESEALEVVNVRLQARGSVPLPQVNPLPDGGPSPDAASLGLREMWDGRSIRPVEVFDGRLLMPGNRLRGPALVVREDTTIWIGVKDQARVDAYGNLIVQVASVGGGAS